ncbi:hypothetical protein MN116_001568 [Schistosoma mekongi]|uniref:MPN domain-containing protein n=1 Tax=Schistosoma mekongi TaxID=38744 RepID=A0AAE1ZHV0_SCHME|nr:hypothetical protein MN116_001568 [Schistosoma mekongi]
MESGSAVHVHPVVLASIVDAYERRAEGSERVIGTLLGTWGKGIIEVTHCYSALYQESAADVCMDLEFGNSMAALERKVNHSHCIVGWYATGNEITVPYKVIHQDYYMHKSKNAILLLVDTNMSLGGKMSTKAFLCRHMGIPGGKRGSIFVPVEVEVECYGPERCAVEMMVSSIDPRSKLQPELGDDMFYLYQLSQHLLTMLDQVIRYVENVIHDKCPADPKIGRSIAQLIFSIPKLDPDHLEQLINSSYKDLLMITYLANLIRTHLKILNLAQ